MRGLRFTIGLTAIITVLTVFSSIPFFVCAAIPCELYMPDETVEFSPDGYTPCAVANVPSIEENIHYFALNAETSAPASIPIRETGTFHIIATFDGNSKYQHAECAASVTIKPVTACIVTDYHTVAHTGMESPLSYRVEPEWAKEFLDINIVYSPIESLNDVTNKTVKAPVSPGLYYTKVSVSSKTSGVICSNKYLVYEIAAFRGEKLSEEEARASVPSSFKCNIRDRQAVYENGTNVIPAYSVSPAMLEVSLLYKRLGGNVSDNEFTSVPPEEPGEYTAVCFVDGIQIGSGRISIDKISATIEMRDTEIAYSPLGVYPDFISVVPSETEVAYSVYPINDDGSPIVEPVSLPLKSCGRYLVAAFPADTAHYKTEYSYAYITVLPVKASIKAEDCTVQYDGTPKSADISVEPQWVEYQTVYYTVDSQGNAKTQLVSQPISEGEYIVSVTVTENGGNVVPVAKLVKMKITNIDEVDEKTSSNGLTIVILFISAALCVGAVTVFAVLRRKSIRMKDNGDPK